MASTVRVLLVIGSMRAGGSERQTLNILRALDRSRFVPLLYLIERTGEMLPEVPEDVSVFAYSDRASAPGFYLPGRIQFRQARDLADVIRREKVALLFDRTWQMTLLAAAAARQTSVRRVSTAVSDPDLVLKHTRERFRWLKRRLLGRAYRQADCVAAISEGVRGALIRCFRLNPRRVQLVRSIVDLERIDRIAAAEGPRLEPGRFHILFAGRLGPEKGADYLLLAAAALVRRGRENLLVHLLGEGPQRPELEHFVRAAGLEQHVRFEGYQQNPYAWMTRAQLFCLPSLFEGMPNALVEALACRIPVVASDCPHGPAEVLDGGRFGRLVPPADPVALSEAIDEAMTNYPAWTARTEPARRFIEQTFSPQAAIARLEQLLLETVLQ